MFLDDDAIPRAGWLQGLLHELLSSPRVGIVGCAIEPIWEAPKPEWLSKRLMREMPILPARSEREKTFFPSFPPTISLALRINECSVAVGRGHLTRRLFAGMLGKIAALTVPAG